MIVHGLAFVLVLMLQASAQPAAPLDWVNVAKHPAGIVLHPLATGRVLSAVFVVFALWSLGGRLELKLGGKRLIQLYVVGNFIAGIVYFGVVRAVSAQPERVLDYPAGALAAMCLAAWTHLADQSVNVFGRITSAAKMYAVCAAIVVAMEMLGHRQDALYWLPAVAAGGTGALLVEWWNQRGRAQPRRRRAIRSSIPQRRSEPRREEPNIDDILAKISRSGLDSLTKDERRRLEEARQIKLGRGD
jgi:membrane associated rhomboid family serine protease